MCKKYDIEPLDIIKSSDSIQSMQMDEIVLKKDEVKFDPLSQSVSKKNSIVDEGVDIETYDMR